MHTTFPHRVLILGLAILVSGPIAAEKPDEALEPRYRRAESPRPVKREPTRRSEVPGGLRLSAPDPAETAREKHDPPTAAPPGVGDTRPGAGTETPPATPPRTPHVGVTGSDAERRAHALQLGAREAARWSAVLLVDVSGRREYYRVGFYDGMRQALDDPMLGRRDYEEGKRYAWYDPEARDAGADVGRVAADDVARADAGQQVEEQFRDLSRPPRFLPRPGRPVYVPEMPEIPPPTLRTVLGDYPIHRFTPLRESFDPYLSGWDYDAWRLWASDSFAAFYDADWANAETAFDDWRRDRSRSAFYFVLSSPERRWFYDIYAAELALQLAALYERELVLAYELGFDEGWGYGAFAHEELSYRRGYHEGFREAVEDGAVAGFQQTYVDSYVTWYGHWFDDWSNNPHPEILSVRIEDADEDGVFEPGERIRVEYELANYGGRAGTFSVALTGATLATEGRATVDLPARARVGTHSDVGARIAEWTETRTTDTLWFSLADRSVSLPMTVNYPLQIQHRTLRVDRDNLAGALRVAVALRNISRLPLEGTLRLSTTGFDERRSVSLQGGQERWLEFDVTGLDPLRLIDGSVGLTLTVDAEERRQDLYYHRLPDVVRDLRSPDLLEYMLRLSRGAPARPAEITTVRQLMLRRLREDWKVAAMGSGNPYKRDYKQAGTDTALGALVQAYLGERESISEPAVFDGMSDQILALCDTLPGVHPFLRKQMRRLARELP
jgi:hypothetical protein